MSHCRSAALSLFALYLISVLAMGLVGVNASLGPDVSADDVAQAVGTAVVVFGGLAVVPWVSQAKSVVRIVLGILLAPGLVFTIIGGLSIGAGAITKFDPLAIFFATSYTLGFLAHCWVYRHLIRSTPSTAVQRTNRGVSTREAG